MQTPILISFLRFQPLISPSFAMCRAGLEQKEVLQSNRKDTDPTSHLSVLQLPAAQDKHEATASCREEQAVCRGLCLGVTEGLQQPPLLIPQTVGRPLTAPQLDTVFSPVHPPECDFKNHSCLSRQIPFIILKFSHPQLRREISLGNTVSGFTVILLLSSQ